MNIQQFIDNPKLIESLTPAQKIQLFQNMKSYQQTLEQEKIKLETEITIKKKEQEDLFTKLKKETNQNDLQSIQKYITDIQTKFDSDLSTIITEYQTIGTN